MNKKWIRINKNRELVTDAYIINVQNWVGIETVCADMASSVLRSSNWGRKKPFMEKKKPEGESQMNIYILTPDDKANVSVGAAAPITTAAMESQNRWLGSDEGRIKH